MNEMNIINRVENSSLINIDLEELVDPFDRVVFDLRENLFQGLILKEKEFRSFVKSHEWSQYKDKNVAVTCSADAIIPTWAYMLVISKMQPHARFVVIGNAQELECSLFQKSLDELDLSRFQGGKVVVKGCSKIQVPDFAYGELTRKLVPIVSSLMFGEPCSTVPVYKRPRSKP